MAASRAENMVSARNRSTPAAARPSATSWWAARTLSSAIPKSVSPASASIAPGEGPREPATNTSRPLSSTARRACPAASLASSPAERSPAWAISRCRAEATKVFVSIISEPASM